MHLGFKNNEENLGFKNNEEIINDYVLWTHKKLDINSISLNNNILVKIHFKECLNFELEW